MAYTRKMAGKVPVLKQDLVFDATPTPGSLNPVTSGGVDSAIDAAKDEMQDKIDEVTLDPSAVALGNVHLLDEVTSFAADAKILVDSETNGPGAMPKDTLLSLTSRAAQELKFSLIGNAALDKYELDGRVISVTNGGVVNVYDSYPNARSTKKIRVNPGDKIVVSGFATQYIGFAAYSYDGSFVADIVSARAGSLNRVSEGSFRDLKITIPDNVFFIAGCTRDTALYELETYVLVKKLPMLVFTPVSSTQFFVDSYQDNGKYLRHQFVKQQYSKSCNSINGLITSTIECGNSWRHNEIYDVSGDSAKNIMQGNSNFIYNVDSMGEREQAYVGPGHGGCIADFYSFFVDGKEIDYNGQNLMSFCESFKFVQKLNCYAPDHQNSDFSGEATPLLLDNDGNKILTAVNYLEWSIEHNNAIKIRNKLIIKRDDISFYLANGAMLEVQSSFFNKVIQDTAEVTKNSFVYSDDEWNVQPIDGSEINLKTNSSNKASHVVCYGSDYVVEQTMIHIDGRGDGNNSIYNSFYTTGGVRLKMYFKPFGCTIGSSVVAKETFNTDDVIEVLVTRKISVS